MPPIVNWKNLKPITAVDALLVAVVSSPTVKELDANAQKCTMLQNAIQDLVTGCKSAHSELISAMSEREKAKKKAKYDQAKSAQERVELMAGEPSPKARRTSAERPTMWEFAPSSEQEIITFSHEDFERCKTRLGVLPRPKGGSYQVCAAAEPGPEPSTTSVRSGSMRRSHDQPCFTQ